MKVDVRAGYMRFVIILAAILVAGTSYAAKPKSTELEARLTALEAKVTRLHGSAAAVFPVGSGGGRDGDVAITLVVKIFLCPAGSFSPGEPCFDYPNAMVVESLPFGASDRGSILTIDAGNSGDFSALADALANGTDDNIAIVTQRLVDGVPDGFGGQSGYEHVFFARGHVSSDVQKNDLQGLEVTSIKIAIDKFSANYNANDNRTKFSFDGRVIFRVAE